MIVFDNVYKAYNAKGQTKTILDGLSMTIPSGLSIGILGMNGAGKSTFIRLVAGTELPDSGVIHRHSKVSWPLGFSGSFNTSLTGKENVRFASRIYGQDTDYAIDYVQKFADLGKYFDMPIETYSQGMKARIAFGLSMAIDFDYYLVDEITAVGDGRFRRMCQTAFQEKLKHAAIIMVSHSVDTLRDYCDRGAVLHNGKLTVYRDLESAIEVHRHNMK